MLTHCERGRYDAPSRLREFHLTILQSLAWTALMLLAALLLAFSPGGLAEMTTVAFALGTDVAFVVTCHVLRVTFLVLAAPALFRLGADK